MLLLRQLLVGQVGIDQVEFLIHGDQFQVSVCSWSFENVALIIGQIFLVDSMEASVCLLGGLYGQKGFNAWSSSFSSILISLSPKSPEERLGIS